MKEHGQQRLSDVQHRESLLFLVILSGPQHSTMFEPQNLISCINQMLLSKTQVRESPSGWCPAQAHCPDCSRGACVHLAKAVSDAH